MSEQNIPAQAHVDNEEWRPIPSTDGYYEVSSAGRIRRFKPGRGTRAGRIMHPHTRSGYPIVNISTPGRKNWMRRVHLMAAEAFIGKCAPGMQVNHKNGIKTDNSIGNLEYVTRAQNVAHAVRMNLVAFGSQRLTTKLKEDDVIEIRRRASNGEIQREIAQDYGVYQSVISRIHHGLSWNRVSVAEVLH